MPARRSAARWSRWSRLLQPVIAVPPSQLQLPDEPCLRSTDPVTSEAPERPGPGTPLSPQEEFSPCGGQEPADGEARGGTLTTGGKSFKAPSHKRSGSRSPAFVSSMIFRATASRSGSASSEGRSVASAISNATPIRRTVSGSKLWSSKYVLRAMREHSTRKCFLITKLRAVKDFREGLQPTNSALHWSWYRCWECVRGRPVEKARHHCLSALRGPDGRGGQDCPCPKRAWAYRVRMPVLQLRHKCTYAVQITSTTTRTTEAIPF